MLKHSNSRRHQRAGNHHKSEIGRDEEHMSQLNQALSIGGKFPDMSSIHQLSIFDVKRKSTPD